MQVLRASKDKIGAAPGRKRSSLSFYFNPPQEELTLDEFENLSLDRLQLLRSLESLVSKGFTGQELSQKVLEVSVFISFVRGLFS